MISVGTLRNTVGKKAYQDISACRQPQNGVQLADGAPRWQLSQAGDAGARYAVVDVNDGGRCLSQVSLPE